MKLLVMESESALFLLHVGRSMELTFLLQFQFIYTCQVELTETAGIYVVDCH